MTAPEKSVERVRMSDGIELQCESICGGDAEGWLIGVHGIGEHLGRHARLAELFARRYNVFQYDLRGHGQSGGRRGFVNSFSDYYLDLEEVVAQLASKYQGFRYVLFGHSMGALIAAGFAQRRPEGIPRPERVFLASPPIGIGGLGGSLVNSLPRAVFARLSQLSASFPVAGTINRRNISHDGAVIDRLKSDPLLARRLHTRLLLGLVDASRDVFGRPLAAGCPLHCAIGSADKIVSCLAAQRYFAKHEPSADLRIIDGAYHELHNESESYRNPYFAYLTEALGV